MSRLESFLRRMTAQRRVLGYAFELVRTIPGPIVELGLGAGRTYHHICEHLPHREVFVFDWTRTLPVGLAPDDRHMILGDIRQTLQDRPSPIGGPAALLHCDIGGSDEPTNAVVRQWLSPLVRDVMAPGGLVVTSFPLDLAGHEKVDLSQLVPADRYHLYRNRAAALDAVFTPVGNAHRMSNLA